MKTYFLVNNILIKFQSIYEFILKQNFNKKIWRLTTPPFKKNWYSSMFNLPDASNIFTHIWNEKSNLCTSNNARHVDL